MIYSRYLNDKGSEEGHRRRLSTCLMGDFTKKEDLKKSDVKEAKMCSGSLKTDGEKCFQRSLMGG